MTYRPLMSPWSQRKEEVMRERPYCELCGGPAEDVDHAVFPKATYRKKIKELDEKYNLIVLCRQCHTNKPQHYRAWAWQQNCNRYGEDVMEQWLERVPLKIKSL